MAIEPKTKITTVLGGGPAGLAVGYFARKKNLPAIIVEQSPRWGGHCVTFEWAGFRYDSGAHRFHDRDGEITREVLELMGTDMAEVDLPSQIYFQGSLVKFPLDFKNMLVNLPFSVWGPGALDLFRARVGGNDGGRHFEEMAVQRYGRTFAELFLLNYTEKLWGLPTNRLDAGVAGKRLAGLRPLEVIRNMLGGSGGRRHMEGKFFYPRGGIGCLMDRLAGGCGLDNIRLETSVTRIFHESGRIRAVELNGREQLETPGLVVSSLPVDGFLSLLEPAVDVDLGRGLGYRHILLVAVHLNKPGVTQGATVYFPDAAFPFTRIYEPRQRCSSMSPPGQTSLVAEIPCSDDSAIWGGDDTETAERITGMLIRLGWFRAGEVLKAEVRRLPYAYPVLEVGYEVVLARAEAVLAELTNLRLSGRNGRFTYSWIHDQLKWGRGIVAELAP
jgi:protoporphyrinogen oxidase